MREITEKNWGKAGKTLSLFLSRSLTPVPHPAK